MKASFRFREEQKPLFRAKIPLNILGLPFQSSLAAGDSSELSLGLSTFFDSGPSFRLSYRPNDAFNPFSFVVKTGIGHFGSPIEAPMTMAAEFNFLGNSNPRFFLHFKPQFGDFSVKKSQSSEISGLNLTPSISKQKGGVFEDGSMEVVEKPETNAKSSRITELPLKKSLESAVSGMVVGAKTELPIRNGAVLNLRWGVKFPEGFQTWFNNPTARIPPRGVPLLVLNKIGVEHVAKDDRKVGTTEVGPHGGGSADVAEACFDVKRQLEMLRVENAGLGKAVEELRAELKKKNGVEGNGNVEMIES